MGGADPRDLARRRADLRAEFELKNLFLARYPNS